MPRPKPGEAKQRSRPQIPIDWNHVDDLLLAGCLGTEIAAHFGIHADTLYDRIEQEKGVCFSAYRANKISKGDSLLRQAQYNKAIKGDNTMMIWLGKIRLGQKDPDKQVQLNDVDYRKIAEYIESPDGVSASEEASGPRLEDQQPILHQGQAGKENTLSIELGSERDSGVDSLL